MDRISLASYSFHNLLSRGMIDVFGYLESVKYHYHLGYADIWNGFLVSYDEDYLRKVRSAIDERGLKLASLCCDGVHPWSDDPDALREQNRNALLCLKAAEILGAQTVRFDLGVREDDITEAQYDVVVKSFREYARRAHDGGYVIGPENHWGASRRLSVQKEMAKRVDSPAYGMLLHLGNWNLVEGETADGNDLLAAGMAAHTHVDYPHSFDAACTLPALREAGYKGVWGLEHHTASDEYRKVEIQLGQIRLARC